MIRVCTPLGLACIVRAEGVVLLTYEDYNKITGKIQKANGIGNADDTLSEPGFITMDRAFEDFRRNVLRFEAVVNETITRALPAHQFDALVQRAFNRGVTGFREGEAKLIQAVNAKDNKTVVIELVQDPNLERRVFESNLYVNAEYRDLHLVRGKRAAMPMMPVYYSNPRLPTTKPTWEAIPMERLQ